MCFFSREAGKHSDPVARKKKKSAENFGRKVRGFCHGLRPGPRALLRVEIAFEAHGSQRRSASAGVECGVPWCSGAGCGADY